MSATRQSFMRCGQDFGWVFQESSVDKDKGLGEVERVQQQLRQNIAESDRMIGEAQQRVAISRALAIHPPAAAEEGQGPQEMPTV